MGTPEGRDEAEFFRNPPNRGVSEESAAVARLARRQGGHITTRQLAACGVTERMVAARVGAGHLIRVYRGVYAVGNLATNDRDRAAGALLAAGRRSALSRNSAAALWGLRAGFPPTIEIISPLQHRIPGLRCRQSFTLLARDITKHDGLRVTSPARTLLDVAPLISERMLDRYHNELRMRNLITNEQLIDVAGRNRGRRGARKLLALAGASRGEAKRSLLEVDWPAFAARYGLPAYAMNVPVAGYTVDVLFTPARLIVELDGWGTHGTKRAYESDRERDAAVLARVGIPTMRITRDGFKFKPAQQAENIRAILAQRPS